MIKADLENKSAMFDKFWSPKAVVNFNGHDVMVVKARGEFVLDARADTDGLFQVLKRRLTIRLGDSNVDLGPDDKHLARQSLWVCPAALAG